MQDGSAQSQQIANIEKRINPEVSGAIALNGSGGTFSIAPRNVSELMEFAKMMAVSGPCVRPTFRGNPGACLALALQAFRTGADPFAVANKAYITTSRSGDEQIAYEAQYIHAVLNNSGKLTRRLRASYSGEGQTRKCTIIGYVDGEDEPLEYESPAIGEITIKNSPLWKGDPDQQLFYYSTRAWGRRHLPEVLLGMYTPDEVRGEVIDVSSAQTPPLRPRPEDFVEQDSLPNGEENQPFEVIDFVGETHEYPTEMGAMEALVDFVSDAESSGALEALIESNPTLAAIPSIIEACKDKKEALSNPGNRQDRPATGAQLLDPARDATDTAEPGRTEHSEEQGQSSTSTERRSSPPFSHADTIDPALRDETKSLAVPVRKAVGRAADWQGTAEDMVLVINKLTDPDKLAPTGAFIQANRSTLNNMRDGAKSAWITVMYELGQRERALRTGEQ